ncbi:ATP/GTP-binding protein [Embleya sp. NPDC005575]|uniref:ATP/GTP-binding protein n=1 Tax=Embleya sp. NPDC005575 TaxID=3156892 RepID=UPI0033A0E30E
MKDLTERIGATFVFAGIDVVATPLFGGVRRAQLAGRATVVDCGPIPLCGGSGRTPFRDLVTAMEACLDLRAHRSGTLPRAASYPPRPHRRSIGSLARLLRQAAIAAILDGTEKITRGGLEAIVLDHTAEEHYRPRVTRRVRTGGRTHRHGT